MLGAIGLQRAFLRRGHDEFWVENFDEVRCVAADVAGCLLEQLDHMVLLRASWVAQDHENTQGLGSRWRYHPATLDERWEGDRWVAVELVE